MSTELLPLVPNTKPAGWRMLDPTQELADQAYAKLRRQMLERDQYTCRYCGFASVADKEAAAGSLAGSGYLEGHHKDNRHDNNVLANLVTTCPLCHCVHHVGFAGYHGRITVIYMPWLTQAQLNLMVNVIGVAIARGGKYATDASKLYGQLERQQRDVVRHYGQALSDPRRLGPVLSYMRRMNPEAYQQRSRLFAQLKILPKIGQFERQFHVWSNTKVWVAEKEWETIYRQWKK